MDGGVWWTGIGITEEANVSRAFKHKELHRLETRGVRDKAGETERLFGLDLSRGGPRDKNFNTVVNLGEDPRKQR